MVGWGHVGAPRLVLAAEGRPAGWFPVRWVRDDGTGRLSGGPLGQGGVCLQRQQPGPRIDDEDSDYHQESYKESYKDRRRRAHTQAEQKRRDAIKRGYDDLQTIVPTCQQQDFSIGSQKLSKAIVLQKTIDYIQFLHKEKKKQEEEVSILRKEVTALKIMKVNYEQIVKAHQDNPHEGEDQVSDQVKFNVFQGIMDSLFQSFNASISVASFQELSACVFSWIEEHCKPQTLREIVIGVLHQLKNQLY
uniref:MAX dimerization protein MLX n=1 Tax=Equus caballus TaxID=9796 RepID=A0A3Q2I747_HORSE